MSTRSYSSALLVSARSKLRSKSTMNDRRKEMKQSTKDQIAGELHKVKGNVKEKAGQVTNNPGLAAEGKVENLAGKTQKKVGQVEKVFER
jgi:uncharacterized protein YjbJ (UPF0337 family)